MPQISRPGLITLMLGVAAPSFAQVTPVPVATLDGTRLDVTATGEAHRVPDIASISAGVVTQAGSAASAMTDNARRMSATLAALRKAGVAERDIQTASIALTPQYRYGDNQPPVLTGYQASNQVAVRFRNIARAGPILDALVAAGANQINGPNLMIDKPEAALDEARTEAMAKARARAELYARAAGLRVARIVAISESGPSEPVRPMLQMAMRSKAADTEIVAGEQTLGITLSVTFELK